MLCYVTCLARSKFVGAYLALDPKKFLKMFCHLLT